MQYIINAREHILWYHNNHNDALFTITISTTALSAHWAFTTAIIQMTKWVWIYDKLDRGGKACMHWSNDMWLKWMFLHDNLHRDEDFQGRGKGFYRFATR
jgi:hypothetical protein